MERTHRSRRRQLARALGFLSLASAPFLGCDAVRGANPEGPTWLHHPSGALEIVFRRSIIASSRKPDQPYERGAPELDIRNRRVFVGSSDRGLYALNAGSGEVLWRFETLGAVQCTPLYDAHEDTVYFGSNDGALYKVQAGDGRLLWRFMSNAEVSRKPVLAGDTLFVTNANDSVLALDAKTGSLRWHQHRTPALGMEIAGHSGALLFAGRVYVGFSDGAVGAYDERTGEEAWPPVDLAAEAEHGLGEVPQYLDVDTTPIGAATGSGPTIFVGSYVGGVHALDAETGSPIWSHPTVSGVTDLALFTEPAHARRGEPDAPLEPEKRRLIVSTGTTGLWALDPETGQELWRRTLPDGGVSAPVPILGALLVSTTKLGVFLLSPRSGNVIDGLYMVDGSSVTPAAHGNRAFVISNQGTLFGLHVAPPLLAERDPSPLL